MKSFLLIAMFTFAATAQAAVVDDLLAEYAGQGATASSPEAGRENWYKNWSVNGEQRSCTTCHGKDLTQSGKHKKTGKTIDPMSPRLNRERLTDRKKIEKWFRRNCKWTLGRECSAEEKANFLVFLRNQ